MPVFQPPAEDTVPSVLPPHHAFPYGPPEYRLFAHYKNRARGTTVILFKDGTCVQTRYPVQMVSQDNNTASVFVEQGLNEVAYTSIARVFTGGHVHYVTQAEADALLACGGFIAHQPTWSEWAALQWVTADLNYWG